MKQFILVHTWKYGEQPYLMNFNSTEDGIMENIHSICEMMGINFEEDNEEFISVTEVDYPVKTIIL